jgi:Holliday junction resolvasome RuvABC ATP-dependent DNA helicase subunit
MDYTRVEKRFWLPTRIEYYRNNELWTVCIVEEITVNKKMSQNLFRISRGTNPLPPFIDFLNVKEY